MPIALSLERWPLVDTTLVGETSDAEMLAYLDDFIARVVDRHEPFVAIVDARLMRGAPSARMRRMIADWEEKHANVGSRYNRGFVLVSQSTLMRGVMRAIHWMSPPRIPTIIVATAQEAELWARGHLRNEKLRTSRGGDRERELV
jgi:hypothetical protein